MLRAVRIRNVLSEIFMSTKGEKPNTVSVVRKDIYETFHCLKLVYLLREVAGTLLHAQPDSKITVP